MLQGWKDWLVIFYKTKGTLQSMGYLLLKLLLISFLLHVQSMCVHMCTQVCHHEYHKKMLTMDFFLHTSAILKSSSTGMYVGSTHSQQIQDALNT